MGSILLVESDPVISELWATALGAAGHAVLTATGPREALLLVRDGGIDVVVVDSYDPRVGVVELARNMDALPDAPPIILISGSPTAPEISARIGAAAFIAQPCEVAEVISAVERLVGEVRPVRRFEDVPPGRSRPVF